MHWPHMLHLLAPSLNTYICLLFLMTSFLLLMSLIPVSWYHLLSLALSTMCLALSFHHSSHHNHKILPAYFIPLLVLAVDPEPRPPTPFLSLVTPPSYSSSLSPRLVSQDSSLAKQTGLSTPTPTLSPTPPPSHKLTCPLVLEMWLVLFSLGPITTGTSSLSDQARSSYSLARALPVCSKTVSWPVILLVTEP